MVDLMSMLHVIYRDNGQTKTPCIFRLLCVIGQVHDEVILEGPEETAKEALAETVRCMEQPWDGVGLKKLRVSRRSRSRTLLFFSSARINF